MSTMTATPQITLDNHNCTILRNLHEATQLVDDEGRLLGVFVPLEISPQNQEIPQHILNQLDSEEIKRRSQSKERGKTTAEVLKRLQDLEKAS